MIAITMSTTIERLTAVHFDLDSLPIGIDNRASSCISFNRGGFADNLWKCNRIIKIYHRVKRCPLQVETLRWSWEDNRDKRHNFEIPNLYFNPSGTD